MIGTGLHALGRILTVYECMYTKEEANFFMIKYNKISKKSIKS